MIASDHVPAGPGCPVMGWNIETWFFENAIVGVRMEREAVPLKRIRFWKPDEENPYWKLPENTYVDATEDQEFLLESGRTIRVADMKKGDLLQHWCGTGHRSCVESVEDIGKRSAAAFSVVPSGFCMVKGGIIAKGMADVPNA